MKLLTSTSQLFVLLFFSGLLYAQDIPENDTTPVADSERAEVVCYAAEDRWVCAPKGSEKPTEVIEKIKTEAALHADEATDLTEINPINPLDPPQGVENMTDTAPAKPVLNPMAETPEDEITEQSPQATVAAEPEQRETELSENDQVAKADQLETTSQSPDYAGDNWFERYPDHWTIQILGVANRQNLADYIQQQQLTDQDYRIVETRANDAPWWVVIYGHYPDREAADQARNQLSAKLSDGAWLRPLSSLKGE